ncbi:MAG: rRNA maturation RNase YbeY [Patescibacteria group bacterium]|mgnify:CR=1 FL=1
MITNLTRLNPPRLNWKKFKNKILGKNYDLSLVFMGSKEISRINKKYRGKNKPTNVLAFPLGARSGEIFIDLPLAYKEAKTGGKLRSKHLIFLYIHALLHLNGFKHDTDKQLKIMNRAEQKWLKTSF